MNKYSEISIVIPTFCPGPIIKKCLKSLPKNADIMIVDNGNDVELESILNEQKHKIRHFKLGDIGLSKSFNFALKNAKFEKILITQPDVTFEENTIIELINASEKYKDAGLIAPVVYESAQRNAYDSILDLKLSKNYEILNIKKKNKINTQPSGDFCVEAVNATAMLLKKSHLEAIGGWDEKIYIFLEDIDLCLRLRKKSFSILKVKNAVVYHVGFGSSKPENKKKSLLLRNWHYCWSSLYFKHKHNKKKDFIKYFLKTILKYFLKIIVNLLLLRFSKFELNLIRFRACINYLMIRRSNFRL